MHDAPPHFSSKLTLISLGNSARKQISVFISEKRTTVTTAKDTTEQMPPKKEVVPAQNVIIQIIG